MLERLRFIKGPLWDWLRNTIRTFATRKGRELLEAGIEAVRSLEDREDLTGEERRALVEKTLRRWARKNWRECPTSVIHEAIQITIRRIRGPVTPPDEDEET